MYLLNCGTCAGSTQMRKSAMVFRVFELMNPNIPAITEDSLLELLGSLRASAREPAPVFKCAEVAPVKWPVFDLCKVHITMNPGVPLVDGTVNLSESNYHMRIWEAIKYCITDRCSNQRKCDQGNPSVFVEVCGILNSHGLAVLPKERLANDFTKNDILKKSATLHDVIDILRESVQVNH